MPDNNEELLEGTYSLEEHHKDEEFDTHPTPPELPIRYYSYMADEQVYKTLSSAGDFKCFVWFQHDFYDEERTNGQHKIVIRGSFVENTPFDDGGPISKFVGHTSGKIVFVDCIFRDNGVDYKSNRDLRDCARWISTVAGRYDGDKNSIYIIDRDDETMHHVNINEDLAMSVDTETTSFTLTYPRTAMMNGEQYSDLSPELQQALSGGGNEIADQFIGDGEVVTNWQRKFTGSGDLKWSGFQEQLGGSNPVKLSEYYRGKAVVDVSINNKVPTSGRFAASELREVANAVVYNCNGNFAHLQARWQIVNNESIWTNDKFNKKIVITGHAGSLEQSQPAFRWNNSSAGRNEFRVNGRVYGYPGAGGGNNSDPGGNGGNSMHIASFLEIRNGDFTSKIRGGGGGGGGGGHGGDGGGGGHGSVKRCSGYFCWGSKKKCEKNGGKGGEGGDGGKGGKGKGYKWTGNAWNQTDRAEGREGGQEGKSGEGRGAGKGGNGGSGARGGEFCGPGAKGDNGQSGENGREQESNCGFRGDRNGRPGKSGGSGGGFGNFTTSHTGGFNLT